MTVLSKFTISDLNSPTPVEFRQWGTQWQAAAGSIPAYPGLFRTATETDPIAEITFGGTDELKDAKISAGCLFSATMAALSGEALRVATNLKCTGNVKLMHGLAEHFDRNEAVQKNTLVGELYSEAKLKNEPVKQYTMKKWNLILQLEDRIPPGAARNECMKYVLTTLVGDQFAEITNRARCGNGLTWENIRGRLIDFEAASGGRDGEEKNEKMIKALAGKVDKFGKHLNNVSQKIGDTLVQGGPNQQPPPTSTHSQETTHTNEEAAFYSGSGSEPFRGKCHRCGEEGHTRKYCKNKPLAKGDGGAKGGGAGKGGKGWKGKKGKGKKGSWGVQKPWHKKKW